MIFLYFFAATFAHYFESGSEFLPANLFCENFLEESERERWREKYNSCHHTFSNSRIYGGSDASTETWPFLVQMRVETSKRYWKFPHCDHLNKIFRRWFDSPIYGHNVISTLRKTAQRAKSDQWSLIILNKFWNFKIENPLQIRSYRSQYNVDNFSFMLC